MQFTNDINHRPLTRVAGVDGMVHAIDGHKDVGIAFFLVGTFIFMLCNLVVGELDV